MPKKDSVRRWLPFRDRKAPETFGPEFLEWLRKKTEAALASHNPLNLLGRGVGGHDWPRGARWTGLSEDRIRAAEAAFGAPFPPDYRLFVGRLHTLNKPLRTARFVGAELREGTGPSFTDWMEPSTRLHEAEERIVEGIVFDVTENTLWLRSWGTKPAGLDAQWTFVRDRVRSYPKVLPVIGHRFLLASPPQTGNPVLSVHQSDIIVYASDLRSFLLTELRDLLPAQKEEPTKAIDIAGWKELIDQEETPF